MLAKGEDIPLVGEKGTRAEREPAVGPGVSLPGSPALPDDLEPSGHKKTFLSFFLVIHLCLAVGHIPRTSQCDPHQQAGQWGGTGGPVL